MLQTVVLATGGTIQGTVVDSGGSPLSNVPIAVLGQDGTSLATTTDSNGAFSVISLQTGTYAVSVGIAPGILRTDITLTGAALQETLSFVLPGFTISGTLLQADGLTPAAGAEVILSQAGQQLVTATADQNGDYSFEGVKPGEYTVQATNFSSISVRKT